MVVEPIEEKDHPEVIRELLAASRWQEARKLALPLLAEWQRDESLAQIARWLIAHDQPAEAKRIWAEAIIIAREGELSLSPQDSYDSSSVLWEIAEDMALSGNPVEALEVAESIVNEWKRQRALGGLAKIANGGKGSFFRIHNNLPLWIEDESND